MSTRSWSSIYQNTCRVGYAQLRCASALSKTPGANSSLKTSAALLSTPIPKTKANTKNANKSPVKAAQPRIVSPAVNKTNLVVRSSASSRLTQSSTTHYRQDGFQHAILEGVIWPKDSQIISLPSGAQLSYARLGRLKEMGQYWVLFHGTPGCRLDWNFVHEYAEARGVRTIAIDRRGYGHSSLHGRGMLGFMQDVEHLLNYHDIQEFKVLGVSGGGPMH